VYCCAKITSKHVKQKCILACKNTKQNKKTIS